MRGQRAIGIDVGGTSVKGALVDLRTGMPVGPVDGTTRVAGAIPASGSRPSEAETASRARPRRRSW